MNSAIPLAPTYHGHVASNHDALLLFEACLRGNLSYVARRPYDRERTNLIKSGKVFIYAEHSSGIKRWTDGVSWSPSRILNNFLIYRELERPFPKGEKKRAIKRSPRRSSGISKHQSYDHQPSSMTIVHGVEASVITSFENPASAFSSKETERALVGSLIDSFRFKDEGLIKKTVSVTVDNASLHLISYYTVADVTSRKLNSPSEDPRFRGFMPRANLAAKQKFRSLFDEVEPLVPTHERNSFIASLAYQRD